MPVPDTPGWKHVLLRRLKDWIFGLSCNFFWFRVSWYRQGWVEVRLLEAAVSLATSWLWQIMMMIMSSSVAFTSSLKTSTVIVSEFPLSLADRASWSRLVSVSELSLAHTIRLSLLSLAQILHLYFVTQMATDMDGTRMPDMDNTRVRNKIFIFEWVWHGGGDGREIACCLGAF